MNFWVSFALGTVLSFLKGAIKNPIAIGQEKSILLEIRNDINILFPGE
jgi:hypothetical protein